MATVNKSNAVPSVTTAKVNPADMLGMILQRAKATRTAALEMVCMACGYLFLVNHFRDAKADGYQTKSDALDFIKKQIDKQANIKGGMLDIYVRNAGELYSKISGSVKLFSPMIQKIGEADKAETIGALLGKWLEEDRNIKTMGDLSEALGYKTGRTKAPAPAEPAKKLESVGKAIDAIAALVDDGKLQQTAVAQTMAMHSKQPAILAREAIRRVTDVETLKSLHKVIDAQALTLAKIAKAAKEDVKSTKGKDVKAKAKNTGKSESASA